MNGLYCLTETIDKLDINMMVKNGIIWGLGIAMGAVGGYFYWYYVGCASGSCPITSSPVNSSLYGGLMGGLLVNSFKTSKKQTIHPGKGAPKVDGGSHVDK